MNRRNMMCVSSLNLVLGTCSQGSVNFVKKKDGQIYVSNMIRFSNFHLTLSKISILIMPQMKDCSHLSQCHKVNQKIIYVYTAKFSTGNCNDCSGTVSTFIIYVPKTILFNISFPHFFKPPNVFSYIRTDEFRVSFYIQDCMVNFLTLK